MPRTGEQHHQQRDRHRLGLRSKGQPLSTFLPVICCYKARTNLTGPRDALTDLAKHLWKGDIPLRDAFWQYAVFYGLLVNVLTDVFFFALLLNDANAALLVLAFAIPIPYNIFVVVAVWRSAGHYPGPEKWIGVVRVGTVIWIVFLTLV